MPDSEKMAKSLKTLLGQLPTSLSLGEFTPVSLGWEEVGSTEPLSWAGLEYLRPALVHLGFSMHLSPRCVGCELVSGVLALLGVLDPKFRGCWAPTSGGYYVSTQNCFPSPLYPALGPLQALGLYVFRNGS